MAIKTIVVLLFVGTLLAEQALATPMLYKKNPHDKYEADLVPVSSTVIPLTVLEVSYGQGGKPSEEYTQAYFRKLLKKMQHDGGADVGEQAPDTLITINTKQHRAKVEGIPEARGMH